MFSFLLPAVEEGERERGLTDCAGGVVPSRSVEDGHERVIVDCRVRPPSQSEPRPVSVPEKRGDDSLSWGALLTKSCTCFWVGF